MWEIVQESDLISSASQCPGFKKKKEKKKRFENEKKFLNVKYETSLDPHLNKLT